MPYIVNIHTGSRARKTFTNSTSIPLSNKEKVWEKLNETNF